MPRRDDLDTILVIGSGPIVIGQACEFDYSGTQAIRVLADEGYRVVLVNSNPATIMTDPELAAATYVEPITPEVVESVIAAERPDALLPTLGGQTALNVTAELDRRGVLDAHDVDLIGADMSAIEAAENRARFKDIMIEAGLAVPLATYCRSVDEALSAAEDIGYPIMVRPSYILGGGGTGMADDRDELREIVGRGIEASPVGEVLVEESVAGWKEFELEVMRDAAGNAVIVCSIENLDPMGVHTGDSITVAPVQTLADREYQEMRDEALACMDAVGVATGGSNVQFAVDPATGRRLVIEMNPRVSRSSALASKATGFPIAKIAALLAVGYTLDEIANDITGATPASFEPALDYVVVKAPRFDFAKFPATTPVLGTEMRSVGEAMAIGRTFPEALQKALRSLETGRSGLNADPTEAEFMELSDDELETALGVGSPERIHHVAEALRRGRSVDDVAAASRYDPWFVDQMALVVEHRAVLERGPDPAAARRAKRMGYADPQLAHLWDVDEGTVRGLLTEWGIERTYKTVDTCAAEFEAQTPYFYGTFEEESEASGSAASTVMVVGSGPNRIGQGIEFDYCCVHAALALQATGHEAVLVNCNPETVSTDYDTSDRLYFEPLTVEDVLAVAEVERPDAVVVQLGGQTPLKLAAALDEAGWKIAGTPVDAIDLAEDRQRFSTLCRELGVPLPPHGTARTAREAESVVDRIGLPVLVRPSYVLGGRAMRVVYTHEELMEYFREIDAANDIDPSEAPILIDRFLEAAAEVDVDAVFDGAELFVGGVLEHVEEAGVHSGDSACVMPPHGITEEAHKRILRHTEELAAALGVRGLVNIQFAVREDEVFVLEANPRASRTVPFVAKATGVPLAAVATRVMMGERLEDLRAEGLLGASETGHVAVKEAVLPWGRFPEEDNVLGPEMRSTGEAMGIAPDFGTAYAKALLAAGHRIPAGGTVFVSLADRDKETGLEAARAFAELGFRLLATAGTSAYLADHGLAASHVDKVGEGPWDPVRLIEEGKVDLVVNTPRGRRARGDGLLIRRAARRQGVACVTTIGGAVAVADSLRADADGVTEVTNLQDMHAWT